MDNSISIAEQVAVRAAYPDVAALLDRVHAAARAGIETTR